jgi:hypothetical protein
MEVNGGASPTLRKFESIKRNDNGKFLQGQ